MKSTTVFLDTNIIIDYLQERKPFFNAVNEIVKLCAEKKISAFISAQSIADIFYIFRKDYTVSERKELLLGLCNIFNVAEVNREMIVNALKNENFSDFEDCIQSECAKIAQAEYIITRNAEDFKSSEIQPVLPEDFLKYKNTP
jgi:predicted nucleic acid-binding protein